jgi:lipopolysaccharide transport system ATP-binding protein
MSETVISVQNLSKQYRLGMVGAGTLREDLVGLWYRIRGKEDPYSKIGETNDRASAGESDYVWALRDVNFEVTRGEVLGIVGKNGAGKSTLLKLLSRVTSPTTGEIRAKGRVASLLEVGTGFHPELTGRENIYLNGAIMGMKKSEINSRLDEIIDFAGVQRYVDTPVKRYSSGMYVRLAFAVAAHLEPEILIVDEVLAVGDAEFQKKAIGKMQEVSSGSGRTVIFVSHNMASVRNLCTRAVLLNNGKLVFEGSPEDTITEYLNSHSTPSPVNKWINGSPEDTAAISLTETKVVNRSVNSPFFSVGDELGIRFQFQFNFDISKEINLSLNLFHVSDQIILNSVSKREKVTSGEFTREIIFPKNLLNNGILRASIMVVQDGVKPLYYKENAVSFEIQDKREDSDEWFGDLSMLLIRPKLKWE